MTAVASLLAARLFGLPETYWALITTLVITQSSVGTTLALSWQRFIGTALGGIVGVILASYVAPNAFVLGLSVFLLGLLCAVLQTDRSAYRFGGVMLAIVMLVPQIEPAWRIAIHRFAEVSIGIVVALVMTVDAFMEDGHKVGVRGVPAMGWPNRRAIVGLMPPTEIVLRLRNEAPERLRE